MRAAVDGEVLAGDVGGGGRQHPQHRFRDFFRRYAGRLGLGLLVFIGVVLDYALR